jgi:hypothetical protein
MTEQEKKWCPKVAEIVMLRLLVASAFNEESIVDTDESCKQSECAFYIGQHIYTCGECGSMSTQDNMCCGNTKSKTFKGYCGLINE